jgi:acyl carrier protein
MAAAMKARGTDVWSARGLGWVEPSRAFVQMQRLLRDGATYAAIMPVNWEQFLSRLPEGLDREFFRAVAPVPLSPRDATIEQADAETDAQAGAKARAPVRGEALPAEQWRALPASEWRNRLSSHVVQRARQVLGVDADFPIAPHASLRDIGLDSLMAVELRNVLTRSLGTPLPATLLFDHPTLDALVAFLLKTFRLTVPPASADAPAVGNGGPIATMSDEEAEALLLAELNTPTMKRRR